VSGKDVVIIILENACVEITSRCYKLFLSKDWFEVMRVDCSIANILLFRIDILLFSKSI